MSLLSFYNSSIIQLNNASLLPTVTSVYEAAFGEFVPYLIILALISFVAYVKTSNIGLMGITTGIGMLLLVYLSKLPAQLQYVPIIIIIFSFAGTMYLFFTERNAA